MPKWRDGGFGMLGRVLKGALAGALTLVGGAATLYGVITGLSIASCRPSAPRVCIGPDILPWYWFLPVAAFAGAGLATLAVGLVLYRRAKTR